MSDLNGIDYDQLSPIDFWRIETNQKKPIGEVSFTANFEGIKGRLLLEAEITVNVTQTMPTVATEVGKELVIPMRFFKLYPNNLVQEDYIDMGIISSEGVSHRYNLNVENRYGKHIVITKVAVDKKAIGMNLKVATVFGYKVAIPISSQPFILLSLLVTPLDQSEKGFVSGNINIYVDVSGIQEKITIPFFGGAFIGMLGSEEDLSFEIPKTLNNGQVVHKTKRSLHNRFTSELVITEVYFNDIDNNQPTAIFTSTTTNRRVAMGEAFESYIAQFMMPVTYYDQILSRGIELATARVLNSFVTVLFKYFTMSLMCGFNTGGEKFEKCGLIEKIDFEYIALGHRKVRTIEIYNPTTVSFIIKRVEFSIGNGNVEISFENHFKDSMKSYYKKATNSMNTFVLIPHNQIISIRLKVKPKDYGNYRETIKLITNHGDYILAVTYKGVQGEILFSPSTLRYDLFYPIESDQKSVIANNKYNIPVEIISAWSPQPFIFADLKASQLMPNSKDNFMGVLLDLNYEDQKDNDRSLYMKAQHDEYVTLSDLVAYEDQVAGWDRILREAKTEIGGEVIVQTDLLNDLKINVKGHLRKALFVTEEKLEVGPLEENRTHLINVTVTNPTERNVTIRFYLADSRMIDSKSINKKVLRLLSRRYARYKEEHICISHNLLNEDAIRYYATVMFDKVSFKTLPLKKNSKKRVCFVVNHPRPSHNRFFSSKGNHLFNITRHSKKQLIKDTATTYVLKDILKLSRRMAPQNAQSLYGLSLAQKLKLMINKGFSILHRRLHKNMLYRNTDNTSFISGVMPSVRKSILQKQGFFISPKYKNKKVVIPPGKTLTLPVLQCYPQEDSDGQMNLLMKNDYSKLIILPISAQLGKVRLIVQKVIYVNEGITTSIIQKKEDYSKMIFLIYSHDLIQKVAKEVKKIIFRKSVSRIFELKNSGNLPLLVSSISVENQGCTFNGFQITNCKGFRLEPGQSHRLEIMLTQTGNFETELKRDIYLMMDSRVLVFSFEVKSTDIFTPELASWAFVSSITHVFRLVAFIFVCILVLILFRHYHEITSDLHFNLTDVQMSKYNHQLFADNIVDLKTLEQAVKIQKVEQQKSRQIRNIGVKQMISSFKEASSREASFYAGLSDTEGQGAVYEMVKETPKKKNSEQLLAVEDQLLVNIPSSAHKKKKQRKDKHHAGVPALNPDRPPKARTTMVPPLMDNILEGIANDVSEKREEFEEGRVNERADSNKVLSTTEKSNRPINSKHSSESRKNSYREDSNESINNQSNRDYGRSDRMESSANDDSRTSELNTRNKNELTANKADDSYDHKSYSKRGDNENYDEGNSSENQSRHIFRSREAPDRSREKGGQYRDGKNDRNYNRRRESPSVMEVNDRGGNESFEYVEKKQPAVPEIHTKTEPELSNSKDQVHGMKDIPQGSTEIYSRDQQARNRYEKDLRKVKDKKREVIYYQRVDKNEEEFPSLSVNKDAEPKHYDFKNKSTDELYTLKQPAKDDSRSFTPPMNYDDKESPQHFEECRRKADPRARIAQAASFSNDVQEDMREEHLAGHNVSGFDQNISMIQKVDDQDPDTSGLGIFKATAGMREKYDTPADQSISEGISEESYDDIERSHEKIRKLMEDTEEVKPDSLSPDSHHINNERVVGVIGEKASRKGVIGNTGPREKQGSNLLGFRQSANNYGQFRSQHQFSTREPDSKPSLLARPFGNYRPAGGAHYEPFGSSINASMTKNTLLNKNYPAYGVNQPGLNPSEPRQVIGVEAPIIQYNQYGSFVPKSYAAYVPGGSKAGGDLPYSKPSRQSPSTDGQPPVDYYGQSMADDHCSLDHDDYGYDADDDGYYDDIYRPGIDTQEQSFGNKPFKAAIQNNPFTLSRLGGSSKLDSGKKHLPSSTDWNLNRGFEGERKDNFDSSMYSGSSYNKSRAGMRPPPGLTNDYEADQEDGEEMSNSRQKRQGRSETSRGNYDSASQSRGK